MTIFTDLPVEVLELILLELPVPILLSLPANQTLQGVRSRILQEYIARATNIPWRMYVSINSTFLVYNLEIFRLCGKTRLVLKNIFVGYNR
jgi:hypothetical protein